MTRRPTQDDLTQRVDELQARLAAIEQNQGTGASGDPERTTRRDMFRRAGITAAGVVGGAAGLSLLNAQTVHAANGNDLVIGTGNTGTSGTFLTRFSSGSGAAFTGTGYFQGLAGYTFTGSGTAPSGAGVFGSGNGAGVWGQGPTYGVAGQGNLAGVHGASTSGSGGVVGVGGNTGVFGVGTGTGRRIGVAGTGITGVLGTAGSGFGVKGVASGSGAGVLGTGSGSGLGAGVVGNAFFGVVGDGVAVSGSGGHSPDLYAAGGGRVVQNYLSSSPPSFPSFGNSSLGFDVGEQVRTPDGLLWISDNTGNWSPATYGGWGISVFSAQITTQPTLTNSDGKTWEAIDPSLVLSFTPAFSADALISLSGAPWSATEGVNQDIGIVVGTSAYSASTAAPNGWTESGGFNTFSPNGAVTEAVVGLVAGTTYFITAVWKANKNQTSKLFMGAGPLSSGAFSPTRLTAHLLADSESGAMSVMKHVPATKHAARTSKFASHFKSGAKVASPAKRSLAKKGAERRTKLTAVKAPKHVARRRTNRKKA